MYSTGVRRGCCHSRSTVPAPFWLKFGYICHSLLSFSLCQVLHINELSILSLSSALCPRTRWDSSAGIEAIYLSESRRNHCFVLEPVISGCVIRNSTEFPYLEEEERRPWGKLRLWQEFIIAIAPIYIDFVPAHRETNTCTLIWMFTCRERYQVDF